MTCILPHPPLWGALATATTKWNQPMWLHTHYPIQLLNATGKHTVSKSHRTSPCNGHIYMTAKCIFLSWEAAHQGETYRFQGCTSKTSPLPILPQLQGIKWDVPITSPLLLKWQEANSAVQKEKYLREKQLSEHEQNTTEPHGSHSLGKKIAL